MENNATDIKNANNIVDVVGRYVELRKRGKNHHGLCPFHVEKSPSFTVDENGQYYYCFGCGAGGDVLSFVQDIENCDFKTALEKLGRGIVTGDAKNKPITKRKQINVYDKYTPMRPGPNVIQANQPVMIENPNAEKPEPKQWRPVMVHPYSDEHGLRCYVIRSIMPSGKKITPTVHWCKKPDGNEGWALYNQTEPRALYNLDLIKFNPSAQIVIVEGEKAADAGNAATQQPERVIFICWPGGTNGIDATDWQPLEGRHCVIIPDNDLVGHKAAAEVSAKLKDATSCAASIKFSVPPVDNADGWDIADVEQWPPGELLKWCKSNIGPIDWNAAEKLKNNNSGEKEKPAPAQMHDDGPPPAPPMDAYENDSLPPPPENADSVELTKVMANQAVKPKNDLNGPFRILGHRRNFRYYMPEQTKQVIELSPGAHTKQNLMSLAPLSFWLVTFGDGSDTKSIQWDHAVNSMLELSARAGLFNPTETLRGRGAWLDEGRNILHLGQYVYINGQKVLPEYVESKFIYEQADAMSVELTEAATDDQSQKLIEICKQLSWENPLSAPLLVGWCVIAPICGALDWRPHIWVTGPAGSGKSTVLDDIIKKMLGAFVIKTEGKTTEAGLRQALGHDARPIIYDEAEGEDFESAKRVQGVLDFARVCSSGGAILKGSQNGQGVQYSARACFCFAAINAPIKHFADETRISSLVLKKDIAPGSMQKYEKLEIEIQDLFTDEYSQAMLARSIQNLETLKENTKTFVQAASIVFKSRRTADQIGALLAGTFLAYSTKRITKDAALEWIKKHDWADHTTVNSASDFDRLIGKISNFRIRVSKDHETHDITIGEAIVSAAMADVKGDLYEIHSECELELKRHGIKVDLDGICIANSCEPMANKVLRDSPWQSSWARVLAEHKDAKKVGNKYYVPGVQSRGVSLPIEVFYSQ